MRINYYRFPEGIDPHTRFLNGAGHLVGYCTKGLASCKDCETAWYECPHYKCEDSETVVEAITVTEAKRLLKKFGGSAWTEHYERDGGLFEVTPIEIGKNNSRFKYNHHL